MVVNLHKGEMKEMEDQVVLILAILDDYFSDGSMVVEEV